MTRRSGSEKRQRNLIFTVRFTPQEAAVVRQKARTQGQSIASLVRSSLLHFRARPSRTDQQAVVRLMGALGSLVGAVNKVGSNYNQFAREVNRGREPRVDSFVAEWDEFKTMFDRDMAELRLVCLQALGKEPMRYNPKDGEG
jgi:hypothetical protein